MATVLGRRLGPGGRSGLAGEDHYAHVPGHDRRDADLLRRPGAGARVEGLLRRLPAVELVAHRGDTTVLLVAVGPVGHLLRIESAPQLIVQQQVPGGTGPSRAALAYQSVEPTCRPCSQLAHDDSL